MEELIYLLKIVDNEAVKKAVASRLLLATAPSHVRVATMAPLSNYGYPSDAQGALLHISNEGIIIGVEERPEVPRAFVPWQNIAYLADGADLASS
jgi:hypothetical protein